VRFSDCLATLLTDLPESIYIETGPGSTLTSLIRQQPGWGAGHHLLTSLRHRDLEIADADFFRTALGRLWAAGGNFDETQLPREGRRVPLPTYAFQHRRYWVEPGSPAARTRTESSMVRRLANFDDWFFEPQWEPCPLPGQVDKQRHSWLVFVDRLGVGTALVQRLQSAGHAVVVVSQGDRNAKLSASQYIIDSDRGVEGYEALVRGLAEDRCLPDRVLSLWTLTGAEAFRTDLNRFAHNLERSFYSLFFLLRALGQSGALAHAHLITISNGARQVVDEPVPDPEKVTLDGPCRVATHEFEGVTCKSIDVDFSDRLAAVSRKARQRHAATLDRVVQQMADELLAPADNSTIAYRDGVRYVRNYVKLPARIEPDDCLHGVRDGGTYLITGGLGGIGLTLAECMARKAQVNLLLISRSGLPDRQDWTDWLQRRQDDQVSRTIRAVQRLESLGARVHVGAVDVTDLEELGQFVHSAESRFGPVRGVVHAAGVVNDSLIALKTIEEIESVFAPKVYGTMVLDMVFRDHPLDFFVVFASSSTITAPAGQVDYVAANAFLNGFVQSRSQREHQRLIAINWGVWNEVGMAATATFHTDTSSVPARHPLFRDQREIAGGKLISLAPLCVKHQWLLDEHRLANGRPLLPGTSFVELAAAALTEVSETTTCELRDLRFLCPLAVDEGETKRARVRLLRHEHHWEFELQSLHSAPQGRCGWLTHVQGQVAASQASPRSTVSLAELARRCDAGEELSDPAGLRTAQEDHVKFGPRWRVLRRIAFGEGEALAQLALPQPFHGDLRTFHAHPALLDIATGCGMPLIEGYDPRNSVLWVPVGYGRILIHRPLPSHIYSWIRNRGRNHVDQQTAAFDVTILDTDGQVLIEIEDFTIQQAPHEDLLARLSRIAPTALEADRPQASSSIWNTDLDPATRVLYHNVSQGILAEEGMRAFDRVIDGYAGGEVVISSLDVHAIKEQSARLTRPAVDDVMAFERPPLDNDYVPPSTEIQRRLVEYWQEMLGIESVGIHDSFFDLGGHSLVAVRLFAKIKGQWDVSLPVGTLLEAPTIAELAKLIPQPDDRQTATSSSPTRAAGRDAQPAPWTSLVAIRKPGSRPPMFIVAGKGGNPMNLRHLAARLGDDQPVYGIQHRGVDGLLPPHESIEEMALACIADVQRVQPRGPYLLGGFSAGGLVAFEMARALRQNGDAVALLVLLDTWDPGYVEARRGEKLARHLQLLRTRGPAYVLERLAARARQWWSGDCAAGGAAADLGTPGPMTGRITETSPHNLAMHAWTAMQDKYVARPLQAKGVLFRPYRTTGPADWTSLRVGNHYNGWDKFLLAGVDVVELPGGHSTMCEEPHVRILAKRLTKIIDDALSTTSAAPLHELSYVGQG
jgi:thioesterase domain-containing protein/NAD(P)-dependent dehydrogenase (short-subunit alcohol dehydrogenase family)/acyl carrier protein